jgi:hypothetical protein
MNNIESALLVVQLNRLFQDTRGLSRSAKSAANQCAFLIAAALTGIRTPARVGPIGPIDIEDARALISGLVEILEAGGVTRLDVGAIFNSFVRGHPASQVRDPEAVVRNSWTAVRDEALQPLLALPGGGN